MEVIHRRAQIINNLEDMLISNLYDPESPQFRDNPDFANPNLSELPARVRAVQKRYTHWTALDKQDALPAILLSYGDNGSVQDSEVVGYLDEVFPIAVTVVMKEDTGLKDLTEQASDMHYALGQLINANRTLGVEGVIPERTRITGWSGSEGARSKYEIIRFRVQVVHRYHATESV